MIHLDRGPEPPGFRSMAEREAVAARKFYKTPLPRRLHERFSFRVWRSLETRQALRALFRGKCAFCGDQIPEASPGVSPFRPPWGVRQGRKAWPDLYWWLSSAWSNLYACCADCHASKGPAFPLRDERRRAADPGGERGEASLWLDPCADRPQDHFVFARDGRVSPAPDAQGHPSPRGAATIEGFDLNRSALVAARREKLGRLLRILPRLAPFVRRAAPHVLAIPAVPRGLLETLARECAPDASFAAPARQFVAAWLRRISASWYETLFRAVPLLGEVLNEGRIDRRSWDSGLLRSRRRTLTRAASTS